MIYKVDINYKIDGLGRYEETNLCGLEENDCFFLGNNNGFKVKLKKVYPDRILLEFDKHRKLFMHYELLLPNGTKEIEIKIGEEFTPYIPVKPSPKFKIIITDIKEEEKKYYL